MHAIQSTIRSFLLLWRAEIVRYCKETRMYVASYISSLIVTGIIVASFVLSLGNGSDPTAWVGFFLWNASATLIGEACVSISADKQSGTFTQLMLRPASMIMQITAKTCAWVLVNVSIDVVYIVALFMLIGSPIGFSWQIVPIMLVVFMGLFGFTMIMASLTVLYTKTASLCDVVGYVMMFLGGVVVPIDAMPALLAALSRFMPITQGIAMSRKAILGQTLTAGDWTWLAAQAALFVAIGYLAFRLIMRYGRKRGINMRY